jgi:hypothetical protein
MRVGKFCQHALYKWDNYIYDKIPYGAIHMGLIEGRLKYRGVIYIVLLTQGCEESRTQKT